MSRSTSAQYIFHKNYLYCVLEAFLGKNIPRQSNLRQGIYFFDSYQQSLYTILKVFFLATILFSAHPESSNQILQAHREVGKLLG